MTCKVKSDASFSSISNPSPYMSSIIYIHAIWHRSSNSDHVIDAEADQALSLSATFACTLPFLAHNPISRGLQVKVYARLVIRFTSSGKKLVSSIKIDANALIYTTTYILYTFSYFRHIWGPDHLGSLLIGENHLQENI